MQGGTAREACADLPAVGAAVAAVELDVHERRPKPVVPELQPDAADSGASVHLVACGDRRMGLQKEATTGPASSSNAGEAYHRVGRLRINHCVRGPTFHGGMR